MLNVLEHRHLDMAIIKTRLLKAAIRSEDSAAWCRNYVETHAGTGLRGSVADSAMISVESGHFFRHVFYEHNKDKYLQLAQNVKTGSKRNANGFNSHTEMSKTTFLYMNPTFKTGRDYFEIARYLEKINNFGIIMIVYPYNSIYPMESFHKMLHNRIGGVHILMKRKRKSMPRYFCAFCSDFSVVELWEEVLNNTKIIKSYSVTMCSDEPLFKH